jgi:hypothetical protein
MTTSSRREVGAESRTIPLYAHDLAGELGGQRDVDSGLQKTLVR